MRHEAKNLFIKRVNFYVIGVSIEAQEMLGPAP